MRIFSDFDEFKAAVGSEVGASEWIDITQDRINLFAQATCDEQWIHVDEDRARKELLGGINTLNYGADRVRYLSPVPAGSRIRGRKVVVARHDIKATISG